MVARHLKKAIPKMKIESDKSVYGDIRSNAADLAEMFFVVGIIELKDKRKKERKKERGCKSTQ